MVRPEDASSATTAWAMMSVTHPRMPANVTKVISLMFMSVRNSQKTGLKRNSSSQRHRKIASQTGTASRKV